MYEYECTKCGHRHERIEKYSGPHLKRCPDCGGKLERVITAPAFQFKGSGWYVTDYAHRSGSKDSKEAKETKEAKDTKAAKEGKERKEGKEGKDTKEGKEGKEGKEVKEVKEVKETKKRQKEK